MGACSSKAAKPSDGFDSIQNANAKAESVPVPIPAPVPEPKKETITIKSMAAMEEGGKLQPYEFDAGELGDQQVEINVMYCGICHSDLSMINNEWGMSAGNYPMVAGHEAVGKIAKVGKAVTHLKVGQVVGVGWHSTYCTTCTQCINGDQQLCASATPSILSKGGFANKMIANAFAAVPIPEGLDQSLVGPMFCGGITVFWPFMEYEISPMSRVGVIGIGGLGHLALMFAKAWGCEVTAFTTSEKKMEEAKELGAHHTINTKDEAAIKAVEGQFDLIINTTNVKLDWNLFISCLGPKGRLHMQGAVLEPLDIVNFGLIGGQKVVSGSPVGSPGSIAKMLEFCARHDIKPVVEPFKMSDINAAIERLLSGKCHYRIVLENDL